MDADKLTQLKKVLGRFPIGFLWINDRGVIVHANQTMGAYLGGSAVGPQPGTLFNIAPRLSLISWKKIWRQLLETGEYCQDTEFISSEKVLFPVCLHFSVLERQKEKTALVYVENKYRKNRYQDFLRLSAQPEVEGFWEFDFVRKRYTLGGACLGLLGLEGTFQTLDKETLERLLKKKVTAECFSRLKQNVEQAFKEGTPFELKLEFRPPAENRDYVLACEAEQSELSTTRLLGTVRRPAPDIAGQEQRAKELEEAKQAVEELSKRLQEENLTLREELSQSYNFNNIITRSEKYKKVLSQVGQVADTDATVLITGETGTGKELLARAIYQLSNREQAPLIKVNCAALPRSLIESELFGHEKGAFTGAAQQRKGRFEVAHRGTIFLDEIGEMPLSLQPKLLRVLQDGEFERVGGNKTLKVDVRVIAATNRNLQEMVERGEFREDLYYRLNVFPIYNIPLRERPEDIPVLVRHFVKKYCQQSGKTIGKIAQADINLLLRYDFPGNVRELENLIERAVILTRGNKLNVKDSFAPAQRKNKLNNDSLLSFEDMQREHIIKALERTKWRVTGPRGAARLLGLKDRTLMSKMRRLSIRREDFD